MQYYNVHSHIFTMENAPRRFLELYMKKVFAEAIYKVTNTQAGSWAIAKLLESFGGAGAKRYASFLRIGKSRSQLKVFESLLDQYDDKTMRFVALTLHMEDLGAGASASGFEGQIEQILSVKERYPERLIVFLGIDPRWKGGGLKLQRTVEAYFKQRLEISADASVKPFAGLKLYPSTGFYAFDERLKETFEWAAENDVPVLSHCNYMGGIYNNDTYYVQGNLSRHDPYSGLKYAPNKLTTRLTNQEACSWFLEPESYRSMMAYFSGSTGAWRGKPLKLCLAHFGGSDHILTEAAGTPAAGYHGNSGRNWCGQIQDMMQEFPTLYTDISYALWDEKTHPAIFSWLQDPILSERIMFGTDFFMTEQKLAEKDTYGRFKKNASAFVVGPNNMSAWDIMASRNIEAFL